MEQSSITLKTLSALSGYSVSTISKALNNKQDISIETRTTILNIAKEHNYVPNYYALSLRKQQAKNLAIIIPDLSINFYGTLLSEFQSLTFDNGYRLMVFQSFTSKTQEKECFNLINDGSVDGVLLLMANNNECLTDKLQNKNTVPTVILNSNHSMKNTSQIKELANFYFNELLLKIL